MGVYLEFNTISKTWNLYGCGFRWEFATREEAESHRAEARELHFRKLKAQRIAHALLAKGV